MIEKHMDDKALAAHLKDLLASPGVSGYEMPVREIVLKAWKGRSSRQTVSRLGSLHALAPGTGREPRPKILITAHMDCIGLMVTQVIDGFCRFTEVGGIDPRILPGQAVVIHGREPVLAAVVFPPESLLPPDRKAEVPRMRDLWLDTGLPAAEAARLVRTGDTATFARAPLELEGGRITGPAQDDRASVAALTICLDELAKRPHRWDVIAAATVQEEETLGGAATSAFGLRPDLAVAVDVTFAAGPGLPEHKTVPMGEGPTIGWGPNAHPGLFQTFVEAAQKAKIPYQVEVMPVHSGTDAIALQIAADGIPTAVIGIPLQHMHSPVETSFLADIRNAGRLLAETVVSLSNDYLKTLVWE
jgi:tetrahedral aminopeptidase